MPVEIMHELKEPIPDIFPGNRKGVQFLAQNSDLQKGLRQLTAKWAALFEEAFS